MVKQYFVGVDVGEYSTGLASIEVNDENVPISILNMESAIHDGGVDPKGSKKRSRKLTAGIARRSRRLYRRRRERLSNLDEFLQTIDIPTVDYGDKAFEPWIVRSKLADAFISDEVERKEMLSIAFRHIARHRGWRSPYQSVNSFYNPENNEFSQYYRRFCDQCQVDSSLGLTPAQVIYNFLKERNFEDSLKLRPVKIRENVQRDERNKQVNYREGLQGDIVPLAEKMHQSDNAYEIWYICQQQGIDETVYRKLIDIIFYSVSPKGSAQEFVGLDVFTNERRASKATLAFQKFRIAAVLSALRIRTSEGKEPLTSNQRKIAFEILTRMSLEDQPTWNDVCVALGIQRKQLTGIGGIQDEEIHVSNAAPVLDSYYSIIQPVVAKEKFKGRLIKDLTDEDGENLSEKNAKKQAKVLLESLERVVINKLLPWWNESEYEDKERLIELLGNNIDFEAARDISSYDKVFDFLDDLDYEELAALENLSFPSGRSAYSEKACEELTSYILMTNTSLSEAQQAVYPHQKNWKPKQPPIYEPIGNPSVDRVLKIVHRYLMNCEQRWGKPQRVVIEHNRDAFKTAQAAFERQLHDEQLAKDRRKIAEQLSEEFPEIMHPTTEQIRRQEALQRQNTQCLYCGDSIDILSSELDHIVPRETAGASNSKVNLAAVCRPCNAAKRDMLFSEWCLSEYAKHNHISLDDAVQRVENFQFPRKSYDAAARLDFKKAVISRLKQTYKDEPQDDRTIQSVAWMAIELRKRIDWYFNSSIYLGNSDASPLDVWVFPGWITSIARKYSGIEKRVNLVGPRRKTRLDRRHHAIDAAVIAFMEQGIARSLAGLSEVSFAEKISNKMYGVKSDTYWNRITNYSDFNDWKVAMRTLIELVNVEIEKDKIPIIRNRRLKFENSKAHRGVNKLKKIQLGAEISISDIRQASSGALFTALTRCPDFDGETGLPVNPERSIVVNGTHYTANDYLDFFVSTGSPQILVQGGSASVGIHHVRIYRWKVTNAKTTRYKFGMVRVFSQDLLRCRSSDLLTAELPYSSLSMRYADPKTVQAIFDSESPAEYIGSLCPEDEIVLDKNHLHFENALEVYANKLQSWGQDEIVLHWVVRGFEDSNRINLRPSFLSSEGLSSLEEPDQDALRKILHDKGDGWRANINKLGGFHPTVIRRNGLGEIRWKSNAGLPVSYRWHE